jgi:hypothetical protein
MITMKKIIFKASLFLFAIMLFTGCEQELIKFDASTKLVGFNSSSLLVSEVDETEDVTIFLGAAAGATATIALEVSTEGIANPAVEGVDFSLSSSSVQLDVGESTVSITTIDNSEFTGNKQFRLKIAVNETEYTNAYVDEVLVTISDDEHPLKNWLGTFDVAAISYGDDYYGEPDGSWDEDWVVVTTPVDGDLTQISMMGIAGSTVPIIATIDTDAMTITIEGGQVLSDTYGYGAVTVYEGYDDMSYSETEPLTGTIQNDGTILIDEWCHFNDGWVWDVFNTTWTRR